MDEQQQAQANPTPPVDPVAPVEQPTVETKQDANATAADPATAAAPTQPITKSPEEEFLEAYKVFCAEKGFELSFEAKPSFDGKLYDFTKVSIVYSVAKMK